MRLLRSLSTLIATIFASILMFSAPAAAQAPEVAARITQPVNEEELVTLRGNTHPLARPEFDRGPAPESLPMARMLLVLQRSAEQETALRRLLDEQQVKGSPDYHRWLTPAEFGKRFGPADADIQAVTEWLTLQGFQVDRVAVGRTVIEFSGTADQVRQAFHTEIHKFVVNGEAHWANACDPEIPAALAPVVAGIASLNNFPRRPLMRRLGTFTRSKATGEVRPLFTYTSSGTTYYAVGPADFATIYNLPTSLDGTGQTVAVSEDTNINIQDVRDFRSMFGLPAKDPQIILNGPDPGLNSDEGEADLDIQWAGAVAKGATIKAVVSESTESSAGIDLSALYIVDNNLAPVMSESYGACESALGTAGNAFYNAVWEQAAAQGITVVISAGDTGSAGCDAPPETAAAQGLAISGIASTPFNVALGGTDFDDAGNPAQYWNTTNSPTTQASAKSYIPETTWNDSCASSGSLTGCTTVNSNGADLTAGSGGPSSVYTRPPWQSGSGVPTSSNVRDIPDVSFFASDGYVSGSFYVFCEMDANTGLGSSTTSCDLNSPYLNFQGAGGTSFGAPSFAGIMALVNQKTGERQGNANYVLYKLAAQSGASCNSSSLPSNSSACIFYDVTTGNNSVACTGGSTNCSNPNSGGYGILVSGTTPAWTTHAGYDLATGLGTVNAANLVNNWSSVTFTPSGTTLSLSPTTLPHGQSVSASITVVSKSGSGTPTGDVALIAQTGSNGTTGVAQFTLSGAGGSVTGSTNMLPGGSYNVTAHYAGNGTFGASDSNAVAVTVSPESSLTKVGLITFDASGNVTSTNASGAAYGSPYVVHVDVTNTNPSGQPCATSSGGSIVSIAYACPTGAVALTANGSPLPDQGAPAGSSSASYTLNSAGHLEDIFVQFPPGSYNLVAIYAGDTSYKASTSPTDAITITTATTTAAVTASPSAPLSGQSVTLTATVSTQSSGAAPGGTVQFMNGSAALGSPVTVTGTAGTSSGTFAAGQATYTTTLSSSATIKAQYSGDTNYGGATSAPLTVNIANFSLAANPTSQTVSPGASATSTVQVTASGGFNGAVALTCSVPAAMTRANCSLNPSSVSAGGTSTLKVTTSAPSAVVGPWGGPGWLVGAALLALILLLAVPAKRRRMKLAFGLLCLGLMAAAFAACGGGGGGGGTSIPGTPAGTYTITVSGTSSNVTNTATFTVTVQ